MKKYFTYGILLALSLVLASCTVYLSPTDASASVRFRIDFNPNIITSFEVDRGSNGTYYVGDSISFRIRTSQSGYISLTAIDPDGRVYTLTQPNGSRIYPVTGGVTNVIPGPSDRFNFTLVPPRGLHRVRAVFTPTVPERTVVFLGRTGEELWTQGIVTEIEPFPVDSRAVAETSFFIR